MAGVKVGFEGGRRVVGVIRQESIAVDPRAYGVSYRAGLRCFAGENAFRRKSESQYDERGRHDFEHDGGLVAFLKGGFKLKLGAS